MTSTLIELRPPPTRPPIPSLQARKRPSTAGYWVAAVVAVLGLMAAFLWGAVGISNTLDRSTASTAWRSPAQPPCR